jgi:ABC-2 type transport system permease protein
VVTCLLLSRIVTGIAGAILSTRRGRDVVGAAGVAAVLCLAPLSTYLGGHGFGRSTMQELAAVVAWTPLGWAWAPAGDANLSQGTTAVVRLLLAVALAAVLFLVWERILVSVLRNPRTSSGDGGTTRRGLGLLGLLPPTPMGAVAGRAGTYWIRDPRLNFPGVMTALLPAGLLVPGLGSGSDLALVAMPLASAYLIGWGQHNDVGYDSTAFWMHVVSGVDGVSDRLGRLFPSGVLASVTIPVYSLLGAWLSGRWGLLPAILGTSIALALNGFAVACVMSAIKQYAVPSPGESPFSSRPGSVGVTLGVQAICGTAVVVLSLPALLLGVAAWLGVGWAAWAALAVGTVFGAVALAVGATRGGALFDRRQADLLQDLVAMR